MKLFNKVTIIGVGLIGGSIGLAVKKRRVAGEVIGVFRRASTMKRALKRRAIDRAVCDIRQGVKDADLIVLAAHVRSIPALAREALRYAKPGAILTDAGSTKEWIVTSVEKMIPRHAKVFFVGSHPMAGSERAGVESSRSDLIAGSPCIVTKTGKTGPAALGKVIRFWKAIGADVKVTSPEEHDRAVAMISHLPHIAAFGLAGAVPVKDIAYAAEGFWDTTRVASSDPELWADIFLTNVKNLTRACRAFEIYYSRILKALEKKRYGEVVKLLGTAKSKRDACLRNRKG